MRFLGWIVSSIIFLAVVAIVAGIAAIAYFSRGLPDHHQLADYEPQVTTRLHAADGRLIAEYARENRLFVPIEAIPDHVVQAFISAEDRNFHHHWGVDFVGIARAAITNLRNLGSDRRLVGASTITQQVAKNFLLSNEVSFTRKIREALLALRIERTLTKDRILELYLNEIYLGRNSYGVAAAALNYFNRSLPELTLAQAAFLAALPKAPNNYDPIRRPEAAIARRNYVIDRMLEDGAITAEAAAAARAEPLEVYEPDETEVLSADYFAEEVRRELLERYDAEVLYGGGLSVRTSMNPEFQALAERVLREGLIAYDLRHGWRGPVTRLESFDDWPAQLAGIETPPGARPAGWELAVVLETGAGAAAPPPGEPRSTPILGVPRDPRRPGRSRGTRRSLPRPSPDSVEERSGGRRGGEGRERRTRGGEDRSGAPAKSGRPRDIPEKSLFLPRPRSSLWKLSFSNPIKKYSSSMWERSE